MYISALNEKFRNTQFLSIPIIGTIKRVVKNWTLKERLLPTIVDFGPIQFHLARHFGFSMVLKILCEISYRAIEENPNKNIYLLSQMIHNPTVNDDLQKGLLKFNGYTRESTNCLG